MRENTFYGTFDFETRAEGYPRPDDYRSPFQVDRDRVIHTGAFRRLQSKTQVFLAGQYDIYRTRLTHSLEVAQIGRSLCHRLRKRSPFLGEDFYVDPDLVEAACLAHDLGHPPFGHVGERSLHVLMRDWGGFEGNAQTLRLLTETIYNEGHRGAPRGMNPTRAFVDSVLKYKRFRREAPDAANHYLYDDQEPWLAFVFAEAWETAALRHHDGTRTQWRSIECQIMDWADDTAYGLHDLVDGIRVGFINLEKVERWASHACLISSEAVHVENLLQMIREQRMEAILGRKIGDFISACELTESTSSPLAGRTNRHRFNLRIETEIRAEADLYKRLALELVFRSPQLRQLDFKGDRILQRLFRTFGASLFEDEPKTHGSRALLPEPHASFPREVGDLKILARLVCDHLASMTDASAVRTYKRLFDPDFGSIVDLI